MGGGSLTVLGHATVVVELAGRRFITDPVLRGRVGHLRRATPPVAPQAYRDLDAVLISHVHHDHLDGASLRRLGRGTPVIAPRGARGLLRALGMTRILELSAGEQVALGPVRVAAVPADHHAARIPGLPVVPSLGYVLDAGLGSTSPATPGAFPAWRGSATGGSTSRCCRWRVGAHGSPGHLDAAEAAEALRLLRPRVAVPVHWGTLQPAWWKRRSAAQRREPALEFVREAARRAPAVEAVVLEDGETLPLGEPSCVRPAHPPESRA